MSYQLNPEDREKGLAQIHFMAQNSNSNLDEQFEKAHDQVFSEFDCLTCANCCKTTSPIIEQDDMDQLAIGLQIDRASLIRDYLTMDEDGDFVFRQTPCPMLLEDNRCKVYENRPEACRDYPHTRRKSMHEVLDLLPHNLEICPAVAQIIAQIEIS